jgi:RimJ/RimL family protein N-acetyltransferase
MWPRAEPLVTERLSLEPLRAEHAREMAAVLDDPALYVHTGGSPPSEAVLAERYARQSRGASADGRQGWLNWVLRLRSDDRPVGFVQATLSMDDGGAVAAELAWLVAPRDQGGGLATEGAGAVIGWLSAVGVTAFSAHIHPENGASAAVARRLGLEPTPVMSGGETRWVLARVGQRPQ